VTAGDRLSTRVQELLAETTRIYSDSPPAQQSLHRQLSRLTGPLVLAVTGPPETGKSTLVNALVGESVAPVESEHHTAHLTWYLDGPKPRAQVFPWYGAPYERPLHGADRGLRLAGPPGGPEPIREVLVEWPSRSLRHTHLMDTPALPPPDEGWETAAGVWQSADAVLFLSRNLAPADLRRVPPARGGWAAATLPLHLVVVLARADETGGSRADALLTAKQIARRRRRDPDLTAICQDVVAVSGLIGHVARSLRQDEFDALALLAAQPRATLEPHLLSVDRFRGAGHTVPLEVRWRERLLDRLGLAGIRIATTLVRSGSDNPSALAETLLRHSGLAELQAVIADLFSARRGVLKARTALLGIEHLVHREPRRQSAYLLAQVEQVVSEAHEFRELRLLAGLRAGRTGLPAEMAVEARRLAGGAGASVSERLGLPAEAPPDQLRSQAWSAEERWRRLSQSPQSARPRQAAQVVQRSCEAILQELG
jgi:hypothetical protein